MPRARKADRLTLDMFGFDPVGATYTTTAHENAELLGLGVLCLAVYHALKRFSLADGRIPAASYYRLAQVLAWRHEGPGRRIEDPTRKQLRTALAALAARGLVFAPADLNEQRGVLQIWVTHGVRGTVTRTNGAGYRAGSNRPQTRASA